MSTTRSLWLLPEAPITDKCVPNLHDQNNHVLLSTIHCGNEEQYVLLPTTRLECGGLHVLERTAFQSNQAASYRVLSSTRTTEGKYFVICVIRLLLNCNTYWLRPKPFGCSAHTVRSISYYRPEEIS